MLVDVKHFIKAAGLTCITALCGDSTFAHNFETVKSTITTYVKKLTLIS
ncbi:chorismate mutase [Bacillus cereus]|uniref:Chorismate mutase n=1 Tax=Bacillus luti TaxID=2026191 RepID=A0A7V7S5N8_9BACI|nr:chorismate mutase [Bacillus luti]KAB2441648.1 chorismate mutase [Bacillus luti]OJE47811.1 chorismate mutase [Bacillus luti]RGN75977.1 chorismate mutase [Bacillus cereus]